MIPRIERIHDLLASISLDEFDPAADLLPLAHQDRFGALEETINLFALQLDVTVREHRGTICELEASRRELQDKLTTIEEQARRSGRCRRRWSSCGTTCWRCRSSAWSTRAAPTR
ncbi:hypothetical protein OV079_33355 [Nannocystis pusilla]|uniref:HAMP domain-containing protein n=1 Tax=Nannocystis pusilla TaxID=889268 RepID=A0A9X3F2U6_9BACT|nr:hypothetical protein [Nannocystis pusilla]MCY1010371.1 hypothetical protein [Nannocystis pusilla]